MHSINKTLPWIIKYLNGNFKIYFSLRKIFEREIQNSIRFDSFEFYHVIFFFYKITVEIFDWSGKEYNNHAHHKIIIFIFF